MAHFTQQQQNEFYNSQSRKRTGVGVFLFNTSGELLLVEPSYKDGWSLVGGVGETGDSPMDTAIAEVHEEIGIKLTADRLSLAGLRYVSAGNGRDEELQIYFTGLLTDQEAAAIKLAPEEIKTSAFVDLKELEQNEEYRSHARMQAVIEALPAVLSHAPFYLEGEEMIS